MTIDYAKLEAEHKGKLPNTIMGLNKVMCRSYEKEEYVCHAYNDRTDAEGPNVSLYFFYYPEFKSWQCGIDWHNAGKHLYSDYYDRWTAAYKELRTSIKQKAELDYIVNQATPESLTPDQIVSIMLME